MRVRRVSGVERITLPDPELVPKRSSCVGEGTQRVAARDEALSIERFGDGALDLFPVVKGIADGFCDSDAHNVVGDLVEMRDLPRRGSVDVARS